METKTPQWGTLAEAAKYWGCSEKTIRRRISDGTLSARRVGPRLIRVDLASVDELGTPLAYSSFAHSGGEGV
jgi:excisionase family DNA binding protein